MRIAVVGAGILGRLTAFGLAKRGAEVSLVERAARHARASCSHAAAGMLTPYAELDGGDAEICALGLRSLELWPKLLRDLPDEVPFARRGSLAVAQRGDEGEVDEFLRRMLAAKVAVPYRVLDKSGIEALEPELAVSCRHGIYLEGEGQIHNLKLLDALLVALERAGVTLRFGEAVTKLGPYAVTVNGACLERFDLVIDCRGLGAAEDLKDLRGVRGELLHVHAPEVHITRPIRVAHPRYPVYVVPRADGLYAIGATAIESASTAPISVHSTLELLSAIYNLHPGFRYAAVTSLTAQARPAFFDNAPRVTAEPGLIRANGLYRHGYLLAPAMVELVLAHAEKEILV